MTTTKHPRKVFGRLKVAVLTGEGSQRFKIEMRRDGIWVRRCHTRKEYKVPFHHICSLAKPQMELLL